MPLLFYYDNLAEIQHIDLSLQFQIPELFSMTDVELCTLLGNLLENAVGSVSANAAGSNKTNSAENCLQACILVYGDRKHLRRYACTKGTAGLFTRKNNSEYHGIGLSSAMHLVEKHKGTLDVQPSAELFRVGIMIPIEK